MVEAQVLQIMKQLHDARSLPRLEIEGAGEPSVESRFLGWIQEKPEGEGGNATYAIRTWYEETGYISDRRTECIQMPLSGIEKLIQEASVSKERQARAEIVGTHIVHEERWDDYADSHDGSPPISTPIQVRLDLNLQGERARITISY